MHNVDEFLKADERLRKKHEEAIARQRDWDRPAPVHLTGWDALRLFGYILFGAAFVALILFEEPLLEWAKRVLQ